MILRHFVVLLCSVTGYFTATNGLYLNIAVPRTKGLESIRNTADHSTRNIAKLYRKGRHHYKKLIILDRKNKRVEEFVKKLLSVIEMNEGQKLPTEDEILNHEKRKINCHKSFGSIYNAKAKLKRCKMHRPVYKRKQSWINFVIPIPIKKNIIIDPMRQGFSEDYLIDFNRRADIDFDYYNTAHRAQVDTTDKPEETYDLKSKTEIEVVTNKRGEFYESPKSLRSEHTRFKIVPNENSKHVNKVPASSDDSNSDDTDDTNDDEGKSKKSSDSESDDNSSNNERKGPMKKIKDEWNDIIKMPDTVPDSSEESSPPKQNKRIKNTSGSDSENENSDASLKEDLDHKQYNNEGDTEKYLYMQGNRLYDTNLDKDSRRMRIKDYFLPKRSIWSEDTINHLGPYWNSHEILGVHV